MQLIAITGAEGVGKSTLAAELVGAHGFREFSFAAQLREAAVVFWNDLCAITGLPQITVDDTLDPMKKDTPIAAVNLAGRALTPRGLLQWFGTDILRNHVAEDIWAHATITQIRKELARGGTRCVISDLRFENERSALLALQSEFPTMKITIVRLQRGDCTEEERARIRDRALAGHTSARGWVTMAVDLELWNDRTHAWIAAAAATAAATATATAAAP